MPYTTVTTLRTDDGIVINIRKSPASNARYALRLKNSPDSWLRGWGGAYMDFLVDRPRPQSASIITGSLRSMSPQMRALLVVVELDLEASVRVEDGDVWVRDRET